MLKRIFSIICICVFLSPCVWSQWGEEDTESNETPWSLFLFDQWMTYITFNFEIYYYDEAAASDVLNNIDRAYNNILEDLGYGFYWPSRRIKIYIYPNAEHYHRKTEMSKWASGHSDFQKNAIFTYTQKDLMPRIIVHELTHLVLDGYMGYPRSLNVSWLHEGLAVYEENRYSKQPWDLRPLVTLEQEGRFLHLRKAVRTNVGFERDPNMVGIWYAQMASVVAYMISLERNGFKIFCENLKQYKNIDEALKATYPWNFSNLDDLDHSWRTWLRKQKEIEF